MSEIMIWVMLFILGFIFFSLLSGKPNHTFYNISYTTLPKNTFDIPNSPVVETDKLFNEFENKFSEYKNDLSEKFIRMSYYCSIAKPFEPHLPNPFFRSELCFTVDLKENLLVYESQEV